MANTRKQRIEEWDGVEPEPGSPAAKTWNELELQGMKRLRVKPEDLAPPYRAEYEAYLAAHRDDPA